jgi:hypothetical protein
MDSSPAIRLLASGNNERGDLFTRLVKDLFFALGYDDLRLDVHKSGREIDIQGKHRFEPRRVIAECKAHQAKMGGDELNKFFGVLTRERQKLGPDRVAGYFVSLSGFTETGIEQELESGDNRIILLNSEKVVAELLRSRVVVGTAEASTRTGQCVQHSGLRNAIVDGLELLGHQRGYVWAVFYAHAKERTHVALVAADGTPLTDAVAKEIIDADRLCKGTLYSLSYLSPPRPAPDLIALGAQARARYQQWLAEECGYIHLDGLPADSDLSATRLKLELLFVPLKAILQPQGDDVPEPDTKPSPWSVGDLLERFPHLALVAMPGSGKSTLLKRLATAYAFPERLGEVRDGLPKREWMPLILRCRELRDRAHRPILELLDDIPRHAGLHDDECNAFRSMVQSALGAGEALLLVDGLDEIPDEGARQTFAKHLRTFIGMFPQTALIITSREAGFRVVASVVRNVCQEAKLAPLDEEDVFNLCERWHVEVVGNTDKVREGARELARTIWGNEHIRSIIENPLLLTTLLVVKRCIGDLPRNRVELYREAIHVLVRTWNVEGYAPLDESETLAQLSYVACTMIESGKQQIGQRELLRLLQDARRELEVELQFARTTPAEFIERIELRSSLLIQTGYGTTEGPFQAVYEFRHLTFQEYLAARGFVEEQYPGRDSNRALADILESHFGDESWLEVISLAAVLAGRKAEETMRRLVRACGRSEDHSGLDPMAGPLGSLLNQCVRDEVQVTAPLLRESLRLVARDGDLADEWVREEVWYTILRGKFSKIFQDVVEDAFKDDGAFDRYFPAMASIAKHLYFGDREAGISDDLVSQLAKSLSSANQLERVSAALMCVTLAFQSDQIRKEPSGSPSRKDQFQRLSGALFAMLSCSDLQSALSACWALAWIGGHRLLARPPESATILSLYRLWRQATPGVRADLPSWAFSSQELLPRSTFGPEVWGDCDSFLRRAMRDESHRYGGVRHYGAFVVSWYRGSPLNDTQLVSQLEKLVMDNLFEMEPTARQLLEGLGPPGEKVLESWKRRSDERRKSAAAARP